MSQFYKIMANIYICLQKVKSSSSLLPTRLSWQTWLSIHWNVWWSIHHRKKSNNDWSARIYKFQLTTNDWKNWVNGVSRVLCVYGIQFWKKYIFMWIKFEVFFKIFPTYRRLNVKRIQSYLVGIFWFLIILG